MSSLLPLLHTLLQHRSIHSLRLKSPIPPHNEKVGTNIRIHLQHPRPERYSHLRGRLLLPLSTSTPSNRPTTSCYATYQPSSFRFQRSSSLSITNSRSRRSMDGCVDTVEQRGESYGEECCFTHTLQSSE